MKKLVLSVSDEGKKLMEDAAAQLEMPVSSWARSTLLVAAKIATTPKAAAGRPKKYRWLGKECTKEEYEAGMAKANQMEEERERSLRSV